MELFTWIKIKPNSVSLIAEKYQRNENSLQEDVKTLKKWMKTQTHLPEILDDIKIQNFLISNKCSIEKSKQRIDMYYTLRTAIPDIFKTINPNYVKVKEMMEIGGWVILPNMTKDMYRVWVYKFFDKKRINDVEPEYIMGGCLAIEEIRLKEDVMVGDIVIFDAEGIDLSFIMKITPPVVTKIFAIYDKVYSIPMKGFYFVNSPPFMNVVIAIIKSILKPKLFERVFVCQDTSILTSIEKQCLPRDYGGEEKSVAELYETIKIKLSQYQPYFDELDKLSTDESLRPEKLENDEVLGFHGNFKRLDVD